MRHAWFHGAVLAMLLWSVNAGALARDSRAEETPPVVDSTVTLLDHAAGDQDDMCVWIHPKDRAQSVVVTADKAAKKIFVYDLDGKTLQAVAAPHVGNIDIRYNLPLGDKRVDIIACNEREPNFKILVYAIDPTTRRLTRIDNGKITTNENYGGALFHSRKTDKFHFLATAKAAGPEQYELFDAGQGQVGGKTVRALKIGFCEGAVADDERGRIYVSEERVGVWEIDAEPDAEASPKLVIKAGEHGLAPDVEGLAIYHRPNGQGYLLVSAQGASRYNVYDRAGEHKFVGAFAIRGARETDGIEVVATPLGPRFPHGLFACHSDPAPCRVLLTPWQTIAAALGPAIDASAEWDPRK